MVIGAGDFRVNFPNMKHLFFMVFVYSGIKFKSAFQNT